MEDLIKSEEITKKPHNKLAYTSKNFWTRSVTITLPLPSNPVCLLLLSPAGGSQNVGETNAHPMLLFRYYHLKHITCYMAISILFIISEMHVCIFYSHFRYTCIYHCKKKPSLDKTFLKKSCIKYIYIYAHINMFMLSGHLFYKDSCCDGLTDVLMWASWLYSYNIRLLAHIFSIKCNS